VVLATVVAVAAAGLAYRLYVQYGDDSYTARILSESERTDDRVTIRFEVRSPSGAGPVTCAVRARSRDGAVVGTAEVPVPAGTRVEKTYTLRTSARAFVVDIPRCWAASDDR
jgi:hypothetical protein